MSADTTSTVDVGTPPTRDTRVDVQPRPHHLPGTGTGDSQLVAGGALLAIGAFACVLARRVRP